MNEPKPDDQFWQQCNQCGYGRVVYRNDVDVGDVQCREYCGMCAYGVLTLDAVEADTPPLTFPDSPGE